MSIERCLLHNYPYDTDQVEFCPRCSTYTPGDEDRLEHCLLNMTIPDNVVRYGLNVIEALRKLGGTKDKP